MKFYVGDYTRLGGPGVCQCELAEGQLRLVQTADTLIEDPTYLILSGDGKTLFATSSSPADGEEGGSVATFDLSEGGIRLTSMHSTAGGSACHLTLSPDERFLYVANYDDGKLTVFPVSEGKIGRRIQLIRHEGHGPNPRRQECPHIHFVTFHPEDGRLYVVDLGIDAVMIYRQDAETEYELEPEYRRQFLWEMSLAAEAVDRAFQPDKLNYELLGTGKGVHMHWHIFPRRAGDTPKPGPVWQLGAELKDERYRPDEASLRELKRRLNAAARRD